MNVQLSMEMKESCFPCAASSVRSLHSEVNSKRFPLVYQKNRCLLNRDFRSEKVPIWTTIPRKRKPRHFLPRGGVIEDYEDKDNSERRKSKFSRDLNGIQVEANLAAELSTSKDYSSMPLEFSNKFLETSLKFSEVRDSNHHFNYSETYQGVTNEGTQKEELKEEEKQKKKSLSQILNRFIFGTLIGVSAGIAVVLGGWWFTSIMAIVIFFGSSEYFQLVNLRATRKNEKILESTSIMACRIMSFFMPLITMFVFSHFSTQNLISTLMMRNIFPIRYYGGRVGWAVLSATVVLAAVLIFQSSKPEKSEFSSLLVGLFYCGYLPSFWIKLRLGLPATMLSPTLLTPFAQSWPNLLGGPDVWTVGLVATFIGFATVIAADTGAYVGGRLFGKTRLIDISPGKTREGAAAGLMSAVAVSVALSRFFRWPSSAFSSATMAALVFIASLFGDLTESMLKRDAGVKDSGNLIPGHGGILDRVDSYMFTGALLYAFVKIGATIFGL